MVDKTTRDSKGRFVKGHKILEGSEKGWFMEGQKSWNKGTNGIMNAWNKGKSLIHAGSFKKGHRGYKARLGVKYSSGLKEKLSSIQKKIYKEGKNKTAFREGIQHPNWQDGKSFEPYDERFNNIFKRRIRKRDNQICMVCGIHREKLNKVLDVHHIDYDKKLTIPENCLSLCRPCHAKTSFNREQWIGFFHSLLHKKYNYQYSENKEIIMEIKNG